jgi:O-antigen/teichoic acid export membrane protein
MLDGTICVFLAEALMLPTGVITAGFLTRRFGATDYGVWTLAVVIVFWVEWSITSIFERPTIKVVSTADDWQPIGATVLRLYLIVSSSAMLLLWLLAAPIAALLHEPGLTTYLRLFSLDLPIFSLACAHRHILIGLGKFRQRACAGASRWTARLVLIVLLVSAGWSVTGAILGCIGASLVECIVCRCYVRPSLVARSTLLAHHLWDYAVPLFLYALTMRFYDKLDLLALKAMGGTTEQAGIYGAAHNLSLLPGLFGVAFSPLLLSTLNHMLHAGYQREARALGQQGLRCVLLLLPFAGMTAGMASEVVRLVFGAPFLPAASLLALLIFGSLALVMLSVATSILIAAGKSGWTLAVAGPLIPLALVGHLLLIPRWGASGAACVNTCVAGLGAWAAVAAVHRVWRILPPIATWIRSVCICGVVYAVAVLWHTPGLWLLVKLSVMGLLIPLLYTVLDEFSTSEIILLRSRMRWCTVPPRILRHEEDR